MRFCVHTYLFLGVSETKGKNVYKQLCFKSKTRLCKQGLKHYITSSIDLKINTTLALFYNIQHGSLNY